MDLKARIANWLQAALDERNLFLVEVKAASKSKVEVYVDGDNGITIGQIAELSRLLETHLDGSEYVTETYTLDVSSPGITNPLRVPRQYMRRIGRILDITLLDGSQLEATLLAADAEKITVQPIVKQKAAKPPKGKAQPPIEEPKSIDLRYTDIKKALIQINWK